MASKKKGRDIGLYGLKFISAKTRALFEECEVTINAEWDDLMTFESVEQRANTLPEACSGL